MKKINNIGINTVSDLLDRSKLDHLKRVLIQSWDEVIFYDYTIKEAALTPKYRRWIDSYKNSNFWNIEIKANRLDPHKKKLKYITENHSQMIHEQIEKMIDENWNGLNVHCDTYNSLFG